MTFVHNVIIVNRKWVVPSGSNSSIPFLTQSGDYHFHSTRSNVNVKVTLCPINPLHSGIFSPQRNNSMTVRHKVDGAFKTVNTKSRIILLPHSTNRWAIFNLKLSYRDSFFLDCYSRLKQPLHCLQVSLSIS